MKYIVAWCPYCDQGWVSIVKQRANSVLYLCCEECYTLWSEPTNVSNQSGIGISPKSAIEDYESPTEEDIHKMNWESFIIETQIWKIKNI